MGKSTISMAIFNSYVKLPEGIAFLIDFMILCIILTGSSSWTSFNVDGGILPAAINWWYAYVVPSGNLT